jgi:hypothetical protein
MAKFSRADYLEEVPNGLQEQAVEAKTQRQGQGETTRPGQAGRQAGANVDPSLLKKYQKAVTGAAEALLPYLGSAVTGAAKGALALPALFTDPITQLIFGTQNTADKNIDWLVAGLLPKAEDRAGEMIESVAGAGGAALTGAPALTILGRIGNNPLLKNVLTTLGARPAAQAGSAIAGAMGAEGAEQLGAGQAGQQTAAILASLATGGAGAVAGLGKFATEAGRKNIAGMALRELADDPAAAAKALAMAPEPRVSGYRQPTAVLSLDPGLLASHNAVREMHRQTGKFVGAEQASNRAAMSHMQAQFPQERAAIIAERNKSLRPVIQKMERSAKPVDSTAIDDMLQNLSSRPRYSDEESRKVLSTARHELDRLRPKDGPDGVPQGPDLSTDPRYLYNGMRKTLNNILETRMIEGRQTRLSTNAQKLMRKVIRGVDDVIDTGMPGYRKNWMEPFASKSQAAERRQIFDDTMRQSVSRAQTAIGAIPEPMLMPGIFEGVMRRLESGPKLAKLSDAQRKALDDVRAEFRRGQMIAGAASKNSATYRNLSIAALIGNAMAGGSLRDMPAAADILTRMIPASLVRGASEDVVDIIGDAFVNPQLAKSLLSKANKMSADTIQQAIARRIAAAGIGYSQTRND